MKTSKAIKIKIDSFPEEAKIGNILPVIKNDLIAAPPLCDAGCEVILRKKDVLVKKDKTFLLGRWRDPINRLWRVPLIQEEKYTQSKIIMTYYPRKTTTINKIATNMNLFSRRLTAIKKQNLQATHIFAKLENNC